MKMAIGIYTLFAIGVVLYVITNNPVYVWTFSIPGLAAAIYYFCLYINEIAEIIIATLGEIDVTGFTKTPR